MTKINLTILGDPKPKKNDHKIFKNRRTGNLYIGNGETYLDYARDFKIQVTGRYKKKIEVPVNVKCVYFRKYKYKVDLTNLLSATNDLLVESGVLTDDNSHIVASHDGSRVFFDKENPRVEIEIKETE